MNLTMALAFVLPGIVSVSSLTVLSEPFSKMGLNFSLAVLGVVATILIASGLIGFLYGAELVSEAQNLYERFNSASQNVRDKLQLDSFRSLIETVTNGANVSNLVTRVLSLSMSLGQAVFSILLIGVGGVYIALDPGLYKDGFLKLVPACYQDNARATLDDIGKALRAWIGGQFMAMVLVGSSTAAGLSLAGIQSALALGVLAGVANMVPYLGSVFAAAVTLVVASADGWLYVGWAAGIMLIVQQIESNVITPVVVGAAVSIPPATGLFAIIAVGILFGPLGILLGFPLTVAADVAIRRLYIRDALDEDVEILGRTAKRSDESIS